MQSSQAWEQIATRWFIALTNMDRGLLMNLMSHDAGLRLGQNEKDFFWPRQFVIDALLSEASTWRSKGLSIQNVAKVGSNVMICFQVQKVVGKQVYTHNYTATIKLVDEKVSLILIERSVVSRKARLQTAVSHFAATINTAEAPVSHPNLSFAS